ncbi:MAG: hypothetical protein WAN35_17380 [Terracidiphilus sp.]
MKTGKWDQGSKISSVEETLRLIARLAAPDGLEERVQKSLRVAAVPAAHKARVLSWRTVTRSFDSWMQSGALRAAAAAAIVAVVVGGGWIVSSRLPAAQLGVDFTTSQQGRAQGGFSAAGAKRTPQTLDRPRVEIPAGAHPVMAAPQAKEKADQSATRKALEHGKLTPVKKTSKAAASSVE